MKKSFITVTPDRGKNNGTLSVKADTNEAGVRYAAFKVKGEGITKSVSIEQDPSPYVYIDCGYIFSSANIREPYEVIHNGLDTILRFDVKFANFILSSNHRFIIKNISSLPVEFNNPVINSIAFTSSGQSASIISLKEFTTEIVPNSENEDTVLSIMNIPSAKIDEIVAKINSMHDASTTGAMKITMSINIDRIPNKLFININVI